MIHKEITDKVITLSCEYKDPKGGIAMVVYNYSSFFESFRTITTTSEGSYFRKLLKFIRALIIFLYHTIKNDYSILHIHGSSNISFFKKRIFICIAYFFNKKIIFHCHGAEFMIFTKQNYKLVKKTLDKVDVVVALSQSWKDFFENELLLKRVEIIKNTVPCVSDNHKEKDNGILELLFLGAIGDRKGIFDLLDVILKCRDKYDRKLRLRVGGNDEVDRLIEFIDKNSLHNLISFEGWVKGDLKHKLLSQADILILPSYNEGLPIVILEAMTYKMPIISTKVGGIPEVVGSENGILIDAGDKEQIESALDEMLAKSKDDIIKMGLKSYDKVQCHLPSHVEEELIQMYNSLLIKTKE